MKADAVEIEELTAIDTWTKVGSANDLGRDGDRVSEDLAYTLLMPVKPKEAGLYRYRVVVSVAGARAVIERLQDVWVYKRQPCGDFVNAFAIALEAGDRESLSRMIATTAASRAAIEALDSALMQRVAAGLRQGKILEESDRVCRFLSRFQFNDNIDYEFLFLAKPSGGWTVSAL